MAEIIAGYKFLSLISGKIYVDNTFNYDNVLFIGVLNSWHNEFNNAY